MKIRRYSLWILIMSFVLLSGCSGNGHTYQSVWGAGDAAGTDLLICPDCEGILTVICENNEIKSEVVPHKYHFSKSCVIQIMKSRADYICENCGWSRYVTDPNGVIQYHDCVQIHYNCGTGQMIVCPYKQQ